MAKKRQNRTLIEARINAGLTRQALADRTQVSSESIRLAELGWTPGPRIQFAIASEFRMRPTEIWPWEEQRITQPQRKRVAS